MEKKEKIEKSIIVEKLRLFNSRSREAKIIAADEVVNYDVRLWRVVNE